MTKEKQELEFPVIFCPVCNGDIETCFCGEEELEETLIRLIDLPDKSYNPKDWQ